jgi:polyhydroxyalkanoate synthesis regulator phasin
MAGLGDLVQKAFYLGVGLASYAADQAGSTLKELRVQAQKLADEMVARGEMTTEEARKYVNDMIEQAQQPPQTSTESETQSESKEPRLIEIVVEDEEPQQSETEDIDSLRQQVESLQDELRKLKRDG